MGWRLHKHHNGVWYARSREGGRERMRSLETRSKREAEHRLSLLMDAHLSGQPIHRAQAGTTLESLFPTFLKHKQAMGKSRGWLLTIYHAYHSGKFTMIQDIRPDRLNTGVIRRWQESLLGSGLSPATVNRYTAILSGVLKYAVELEMIHKSLIPTIPHLREERAPRRVFSDGEIEALFRESIKMDSRTALFVRLGILAGLRRGEILSLRSRDVDWDNRMIVICDHRPDDEFHPKSRQERRIPMHPELTGWLTGEGGYYFPGRGKPFMGDFRKGWADLLSRCGIADGPGPHTMRHTFGTLLARRGCSAWEIQVLLGHANVTTTEVYVRMAGQRELVTAIGKILPIGIPAGAPTQQCEQ